jgi:23S rRNA pseudouridine1911/1915/1917 synthase
VATDNDAVDDKDQDPGLTWLVGPEEHGQRLDVYLFEKLSSTSRSKVQRLIESDFVSVDDFSIRPSFRLKAGQTVTLQCVELPTEEIVGEDIPLRVLYEDEDIAAIDKVAGMVVHPAKGHWSGTLTAALAFRFKELSTAGGSNRPGIVHRLDRDTSGVILVAKSDRAHHQLTKQFERRTVKKHYVALVSPAPDRDADLIEQPIGIHPYQREKMMVRGEHSTSRPAITYYEVRRRFQGFAQIDVFPRTGRTHQIRVHLAHVGSPVLCDRLYSGRARITRGMLAHISDEQVVLDRQALHAAAIEFQHPITHLPLRIESPLPADIRQILELLEAHRAR